MRTRTGIAGRAGLILLTITTLALQHLEAQPIEAIISRVTGRVELRNGAGAWRPAAAGDVVAAGTTVSTGFGAEAQIRIGESMLQVRELSRMTLEELVEREDSLDTDLFLQIGRIRSEVRSTRGLENNFQLRSTQATAAVRGTSFDFDGINLKVDAGLVSLANRLGKQQRVGRGQSSSADGYNPPQKPQQIAQRRFNVSPFTSPDQSGTGRGEPSDDALVVIRILWE